MDESVALVVDDNEGDETVVREPYQEKNGYWRVGPQSRAAHSHHITSWPIKWARNLFRETVNRNSRKADAKAPGVTEEELAEAQAALRDALEDRLV